MKKIPIENCNYYATEDGLIYNRHGELRNLRISKNGYQTMMVRIKNKLTNLYIHRLIALTFIPNPLNLKEVNHIDGNKLNNNINNLEWCTHKNNMKHASNNGLIKYRGYDNPNAKLTDIQIEEIRNLYSSKKYTQRAIANLYGITQGYVANIIRKHNRA